MGTDGSSGDGSSGDGTPFGNAEELKGFKALSPELAPEVRELALAMRGLFQATGKSLRQFAAYHHLGAASISRFLAGDRLPEKRFLDDLMKSACATRGLDVTAELQGHLYQLHREALLAVQPARYREQMASDRLEDAILQKEQAELHIRDLQRGVSDQKRQLHELRARIRQIEAAGASDRRRLGAELELRCRQKADLEEQCDQLRETIGELEAALDQAVRERDAAQVRCAELEEKLAAAGELAEREELERQAREERLRMAKAADAAQQYVEDLERAQREADQVRLEAARYAAAQREEAEQEAREILDEASRALRMRPLLGKRGAALRQLRDAAEEVAQRRLPELIGDILKDAPPAYTAVVPAVAVDSRDEIGQVAVAFDEVVRLAAEQARLLRNVMDVSLNLSRRDLVLTYRQLSLLDEMESREAEPGMLPDLFRLDHLATRSRRHIETLLVLLGEEPQRRWTRPVPLTDVLRAATAEVEDYDRVELASLSAVGVAGRAAPDLIHLLAELLENATAFSPPHTTVRVTAPVLSDGRVLIEIGDSGLGLTREQTEALNARLAEFPKADASVGLRMGLFVVGRLSHRHGIRVQLRPSDTGGTTALVMLPADVVGSRGI